MAGRCDYTFSAHLDSELLLYKNIMSDKQIAIDDKILNSGKMNLLNQITVVISL